MIFAQFWMFFFAVFVVLWVWFLQDFHTKKTKTERQGDRDIQHKGHIWGKAERGTKAPPSCSFAPNPLPGQGPGGGAGGQPLNPLMQECSRHGGGDGPQGNWINLYIYIYTYAIRHSILDDACWSCWKQSTTGAAFVLFMCFQDLIETCVLVCLEICSWFIGGVSKTYVYGASCRR